jgi:hypothetical protein
VRRVLQSLLRPLSRRAPQVGAALGVAGAAALPLPAAAVVKVSLPGFICEAAGVLGAEDTTGFGGWRRWLKARAGND